jgi:hypothetical protein
VFLSLPDGEHVAGDTPAGAFHSPRRPPRHHLGRNACHARLKGLESTSSVDALSPSPRRQAQQLNSVAPAEPDVAWSSEVRPCLALIASDGLSVVALVFVVLDVLSDADIVRIGSPMQVTNSGDLWG